MIPTSYIYPWLDRSPAGTPHASCRSMPGFARRIIGSGFPVVASVAIVINGFG
jgi:hypothetical protein